MENAPKPQGIFDEHTFEAEFIDALNSAEKFAYIESAYITVKGVQRFDRYIQNAADRGVRICTYVQTPEEWSERHNPHIRPEVDAALQQFDSAVKYMRRLGAHVTLRKGTHLKVAVFDGVRSYEGSLNMLSYTKRKQEEQLRWIDEDWSHRLIKRRRLHECHECIAQLKEGGAVSLGESEFNLGKQVHDVRCETNMSQDQLAMRVGLTRETISRIECGKTVPRADVLMRILNLGNKRLLVVTPSIVSIIKRWTDFSSD